jgi:pimeloyl-ACP methyl ester carboxylesterase
VIHTSCSACCWRRIVLSETLTLRSGRRQLVFRAGDGPPLVWFHSLYGVEPDTPVVDALAQRYSVFAPLAPGFADLEELANIRDIHDLALHYDDVLEALELRTAVLAGHSFGAMIAAEVAAHAPQRVSELVLCSALGLWNDAYPVADLFGIPPTEMPRLLYVDPPLAQGGGAKPDVESVITLARGMATVARFLWPIPDRGLSRRLYRVRAPTLIIHGALDRWVPAQYADDFAALLPHASRRLIAGAGHMLFADAFEQSIAIILGWLSEATRSRLDAKAVDPVGPSV